MSSDIELVGLAKKGDHIAFKQLVTKYKGTVFNIIYSVTGAQRKSPMISPRKCF